MDIKKNREIRIQIFEAQDLLVPNTNGGGHKPIIYLQMGKFHDTILPIEEERTPREAVHYEYDRIMSFEDKFIITIKDNSILIGSKTISCKKLSVMPTRKWYELKPENRGKILIELTAINWGSIPKPRSLDTSSCDEKQYYMADTLRRSLKYISKPPIKEYKESHIKRIFPHIGQGTFGIVYKGNVKDKKHLIVAIKDIKVKDYTTFEEWKKEVEYMSHNIHKYVVEVFGYYCSSDLLTIVMEYLERGTLFDLLHISNESVQFTILDRLRMARHVAIAIGFMHNHGVIHRDVKSMNILVGKDNICKLSDFGSAKLIKVDQITMNTMGKGTPFWMAPEVMIGNSYSFPADIYSFGIVLYEIFENTLPQYDYERRTIMLESYNFSSSALVLPMLEFNTQSRPTSIHIAERLDHILNQVLIRLGVQLDSQASLDEWFIQNSYVGQSTPQIDELITNLIREKFKIEPKISYHLIPSKKVKSPRPLRPAPDIPKAPSASTEHIFKAISVPSSEERRSSFVGYHPTTDRMGKSWNIGDSNLLKSERQIRIGDKHGARLRIRSEIIKPADTELIMSHEKLNFLGERNISSSIQEYPTGSGGGFNFSYGQIITLDEDYHSEGFSLKKYDKVHFLEKNLNSIKVRKLLNPEEIGWINLETVKIKK